MALPPPDRRLRRPVIITLPEKGEDFVFPGPLPAELYDYAYDDYDAFPVQQPVVKAPKIYPNDPCPSGSGKKYKKCCGKRA